MISLAIFSHELGRKDVVIVVDFVTLCIKWTDNKELWQPTF